MTLRPLAQAGFDAYLAWGIANQAEVLARLRNLAGDQALDAARGSFQKLFPD